MPSAQPQSFLMSFIAGIRFIMGLRADLLDYLALQPAHRAPLRALAENLRYSTATMQQKYECSLFFHTSSFVFLCLHLFQKPSHR